MTLGVALFLIFVLYLIDKHNLWRLTAKIAAGLAVLAIVAAGGLYAWVKYQDYRTEKREAEQIAAHKAKVEACVARLTAQERSTKAVHTVPIPPGAVIGGPQYLDDNGNPIPQPPGHYLIRAACEADPSVTVTEPVPPPRIHSRQSADFAGDVGFQQSRTAERVQIAPGASFARRGPNDASIWKLDLRSRQSGRITDVAGR